MIQQSNAGLLKGASEELTLTGKAEDKFWPWPTRSTGRSAGRIALGIGNSIVLLSLLMDEVMVKKVWPSNNLITACFSG